MGDISDRQAVAVMWRMTESGAVIGQDRVWLVGDSLDYAALWAPLRRSPSQAHRLCRWYFTSKER